MLIGLNRYITQWCIWCLFLMAYTPCLVLGKTSSDLSDIDYQISFCQTKIPVSNIEQAIDCDYESPYNPLDLSFGEGPRWVRVKIDAEPKKNQLFSIHVRPHFLREINFFKQVDGQWVIDKGGSYAKEDLSHSDIGGYFFITPVSSKKQNTYYIKVQATSIARIYVSVIPWPNSTLRPSGHLLGIGAQLGILITILIFSLVSLSLNPTAVMGRFSIYIFNLIVCLVAGSGILALYVFKQMPIFNEMVFFSGLCLKLALWVWLAQALLQDYKTPPWYKTTCWSIYSLVGLCIILGSFGHIDLSILLILIGYTVTSISQIYATIQTPKIEKPLQVFLIIGFSASIGLIYLAVVSTFFPLDANSQVPIYLSRLTDFVNPLVMLSIIVFQNRMVRKELAQVKTTLTETQLKAKYESKLLKDRKTLVDMFAHELKNPLASIGLAVETLSQTKDGKTIGDQRRLENINAAILSMDNIIERCSLINSIDQKSIPLNKRGIDLKSFISNLVNNLNEKRQIDLQMHKEIQLHTDSQFLQIILHNLIENALKYSPADTAIQINVKELSSANISIVQISIANSINPDWMPDPEFMFERFYRHALAKETRGSGLGLSICKELCIALGGRIDAQLSSNEAKFIIELPQ